MTDLTWALNQVSDLIKEPEANLALFRIPATPNVLTGDVTGVLRPAPEELRRRYLDVEDAERLVRRSATQEFLRYLMMLCAEGKPQLFP